MFYLFLNSIFMAGLMAFTQLAAADPPAHGSQIAPAGHMSGDSSVPVRMSVPFELAEDLIVVQAEVNGVAGNFIVDSGAQYTVLNEARYEPGTIESEALGHQAPSGAGGRMNEVRGSRDLELRWGSIEMKGLFGLVTDLTHLEQNLGGIELQGLIGYNVLEFFLVHFDYAQRQLTLLALGEDNRPVDQGGLEAPVLSVPFDLTGHIPVIPVNVGGLELKFGLDSGAADAMIFTRWREELEGQYEFIRRNELTGADLNVQMGDVVKIPNVEMAGISYGDMIFRFNDLQLHADREVSFDGMLGYEFLKSRPTAINFRSRELLLWPESKGPGKT